MDTANRPTMWRECRERHMPARMVHMLSTVYDDGEAAIVSGNRRSRKFRVRSGVIQGGKNSPKLYSTTLDKLAKEHMKRYKDAGRYVKEHDMVVGDLVIAKRKTTKHESAYDPRPYKVYKVHGTQIKAMREDGKQKRRCRNRHDLTIRSSGISQD